MMLRRRRRPQKLRGKNIPIARSYGKIEVGNDSIQNQDGRAQAIAMFEYPTARLARELRHETEANDVLRASVFDRIALWRVRSGNRRREQRPRPKLFLPGTPQIFALKKSYSPDACLTAFASLDHW